MNSSQTFLSAEEEDLIAIIQTTVFSLKFASLKDPIIEPTGLTGHWTGRAKEEQEKIDKIAPSNNNRAGIGAPECIGTLQWKIFTKFLPYFLILYKIWTSLFFQ